MKLIKKVQTKDYIVNEIKREILLGNIKAGEELVQENIAELLGVSRMPVREAFQMLEQEGFIERLPNRHMQVVQIKSETIESVFRVLSSVECQIIEELWRYHKDITTAVQLHDQYQQDFNRMGYDELTELEIDIHKELTVQLDNPYLLKLHHALLDGYFTFARGLGKERNQEIRNRMDQLLGEVKSKNADHLRKISDQYFGYIAQILISKLGDKENE